MRAEAEESASAHSVDSQYGRRKPMSLFAGIPVSDYTASLAWYRAFLEQEPSFFPNDIEAVWEIAENAWLYIERLPERAGKSMHMVMVDDIDSKVAALAERGMDALRIEEYDDGMRKVVYLDPDGNEISCGGVSKAALHRAED
jgi:catechol 2,3-dioxygenase-like lactoylglutathione lyase family enzyme